MNRLDIAMLSLADYASIRNEYSGAIYGIIEEYLRTDKVRLDKFRNSMKRVMTQDFDRAYAQGFADAGTGSTYPNDAEPEDIDWLAGRIIGELANIDLLFYRLRDLKKEAAEEPGLLDGVAYDKAEGYARTLDGIYSEGKMRGGKNVMLTFVGNDGKENCATCRRLKGKRHKASWWTKRGLEIYRGNENYECGCWQCQHFLMTDKGEPWTF